jgi:hypothetical protein
VQWHEIKNAIKSLACMALWNGMKGRETPSDMLHLDIDAGIN